MSYKIIIMSLKARTLNFDLSSLQFLLKQSQLFFVSSFLSDFP